MKGTVTIVLLVHADGKCPYQPFAKNLLILNRVACSKPELIILLIACRRCSQALLDSQGKFELRYAGMHTNEEDKEIRRDVCLVYV